jgi:hypothetical protein
MRPTTLKLRDRDDPQPTVPSDGRLGEHFDADGEQIDTAVTPGRIEKWVDVDSVTITRSLCESILEHAR